MKLKGSPIKLNLYEASEVLTNKHFKEMSLPEFDRIVLPQSMTPFMAQEPLGVEDFLRDDNRGAVCSEPCLNIDGADFYQSAKGIGSSTNPFSRQVLGKAEICSLIDNDRLKQKIVDLPEVEPRFITGELWLRGSPYGGQGLEHAETSMKVSEMADLTTIHGFRVAPLVKTVFLPQVLEQEVKKIFWYRQFKGRIVQEIRLVPSNIRIYFHGGSTVGGNVQSVFDLFGVNTNEKALSFLRNFVKSGIAFLTLFSRSLRDNGDGYFGGLDFYDVWLDKDAVLSADGTIYFVDLEGLEWVNVAKNKIQEKINDQIFRSLYEFMYAYSQIERERSSRFGDMVDRKVQFERLLREALKDDEICGLAYEGQSLKLVVGNIIGEQGLTEEFTILDR
jgi:hypothetical protein